MNPRERAMCAFRHRQPDRTPIFEYVLGSPVADAILGRPYADGDSFDGLVRERGWEAAVRQQATDRVELAAALGHDMLYVTPNPPPPRKEPHAEPSTGPSAEPHAEAIASGGPGQDPVLEITRRLQGDDDGVLPQPDPICVSCDSRSDSCSTSCSDPTLLIYSLVRKEMKTRGMDLPLMAPAYAHGVWTDTALMQAMVLDPELTHRYFARCTRQMKKVIAEYLKLGIEIIGVGGDFAGNSGPLVSPALYREFIVPEVRELSRFAGGFGAKVVNASDGNLWPVLDDFLLGCGVDGYIEIQFRAGMDLGRLKATYGGRITFLGNLDCSLVLGFGSPGEVKEHTMECLRKGWGNGGHILCCDNAVTESVPLGNYLAIGEAYREYFGIA